MCVCEKVSYMFVNVELLKALVVGLWLCLVVVVVMMVVSTAVTILWLFCQRMVQDFEVEEMQSLVVGRVAVCVCL